MCYSPEHIENTDLHSGLLNSHCTVLFWFSLTLQVSEFVPFIFSTGLRQSEATYKCLLCTVFLSQSVTRLHDVTNATMGNSSK